MHRFKSMQLESDSVLKNKNIKSLVGSVLGFNIGEKIKLIEVFTICWSHLLKLLFHPHRIKK